MRLLAALDTLGTMLLMVLRKMYRNKWLMSCLLAGSVITAALVASIPLYTDGVLQRLLTRDLESYQTSQSVFPGRYAVNYNFTYLSDDEFSGFDFSQSDRRLNESIIPALGIPVLARANELTADYLSAVPAVQREAAPRARLFKLMARDGLQDHVRILHGRMVDPAAPPEVIEVVVTEEAFEKLQLLLGEEYVVGNIRDSSAMPWKVKVVGVFATRDATDPWWSESLGYYDESMMADYGLFRRLIVDTRSRLLTETDWYFALDYHAITIGNLRGIVRNIEDQIRLYDRIRARYDIPLLPTLQQYFQRQSQLVTTLAFLQVPVLIALAFYLYLVSFLIVDAEKNEIAVVKSRGAGGAQIFIVYLLESLLLSAVAFLAGPPLGFLICRMIGSSNGFMEFVQRTGLPVTVSLKAYLYSAGAAALLMGTMLLPAYTASKTTIVAHKQMRSRAEKAPRWKRLYLDLVLIAISAYGYYAYRTQRRILEITSAKAGELPLDPLLFLISAFFVLGVGLAFLRLYPLLVRLVFRVGRRIWPPGLYATILGIGRSRGQEQYIMLFLILTLSMGILNAKAARTINTNAEDKIRYAAGADITLLEDWPKSTPGGAPVEPASAAFSPLALTTSAPGEVEYREPDFGRFTSLPGVALATKVFRNQEVHAEYGRGGSVVAQLLGIVPAEFASVADFRPGLLPYHQNQYLNLLLSREDAILVSRSFADKHGVKLGDSIGISWAGQGVLEGTVYGFVPYWPTYNPFGQGQGGTNELVVANLSYIQAHMALEPYEVWLRMIPGSSHEELYHALTERNISIVTFSDVEQKLVAVKNDAMLQGTNGALTMGFIVALVISVTGYLISWIISIRGRALQFGIYRAMGLTRLKVAFMLIWEQVLVSLVAILAGIFIGGIAGDLFVPLLEIAGSAAQQVPPFQVIADRGDYLRLYAIVGAMLLVGGAALVAHVSRARITEAIKLGEE